MTEPDFNNQAKVLAEAFEAFNKTTQSMEEAYRRLESRVRDLDAELAAKHHELAFTMDYLNAILESISDGVVAVDIHGGITTFNRAASSISGYSVSEVTGRLFRDVFGREFISPGDGSTGELRRADGTVRPVLERDGPLADKSGHVIGAVKVFQDVSEIEELRERVRRKDRLAALGEMAATVAHEIRNPLGGIRGFASLLARDLDGDEPKLRIVEKVIQGTKALDKVVNDLLEYTRPIEFRPRPTDCADLVEPVLGLLEFDGRDIEVRCDVPSGLHVSVDPDRMRQVILNILINAVQSIDGAGTIHVRGRHDGTGIRLSIEDTGSGMTEDQLKQAFMPFYTTKDKGTGLGLASAAKIVEGHGGEIRAESEAGRGSRFHIHLPQIA